ncbi:peptidase inhibitor family I36 protein [Amycolatopsis sp. VS8301801F10]|uniref:peptidase inhibitor family I36 protein n=1 Tax=Amycolatopsis sp. VS8301801F10 TaxID=2652442 RepID=UPI0038FD1643
MSATVAVAGVVTLVGMGGGVDLGAQTSAPNALPECAENFVCFWSEPNFGGQKIQEPPDWATGSHCIRLPFSARSALNNTKERQRGYLNSDCSDGGTILQYRGAAERSININAYKHT